MCKLGSPALLEALRAAERPLWGPLVVSDGFVLSGQSGSWKASTPPLLHTVIRVFEDEGSFAKGVLLSLHTRIHARILSLWYALSFLHLTPY